MKKTLFFLMLLPLVAFSQAELVRWNGNPNTQGGTFIPTTVAQNVSAESISFGGLTPNPGEWNFFTATGWTTAATPNYNQYIQFVVGGSLNNTVTINEIDFQYNGGQRSYAVRYAKAVDSNNELVNPQELTYVEGTAVATNSSTSGKISNLNIIINGGEKLYVRISSWNGNGQWNSGVFRLVNNVIFRGVATAPQPLNGTYTIGSASTNNFKTITQAVNALNNIGISGQVTFLLNNELYNNASGENFPITINQFEGTSAANTVTFKPNVNKNVRIDANNISGQNGVASVFLLNGADNIIFDGSNKVNGTSRNLTVSNNNTPDYIARGVFMVASNGSNGSENITIKNTNIRQDKKNQPSNYTFGIYSGNNSIDSNNSITVNPATANNANLTILNNNFINVKQGVYINGNATIPTTNVLVHLNDLGSENNTETIINPVYLSNVNVFTVSENLVYNLYRDGDGGNLTAAGVTVTDDSKNGKILSNRFTDLHKTSTNNTPFTAILLSSTNNNADVLVANNFILDVHAPNNGNALLNGHGIVAQSGGGYKIYHNTVKLNKVSSEVGASKGYTSALFINDNVINIDVRNNIFINTQDRTSTERFAIIVRTSGTTFTNLDYNNYYSSQYIGHFGPNPNDGNNPNYRADIVSWRTLVGGGRDANSKSVNVEFVSATDLHITDNNVDLSGTGGLVTHDIDGQIRSTTAPTMGADEYGYNPIIPEPEEGQPGIFCEESTTWTATGWSNGLPSINKDVIFEVNYTQNGGNLEACSIFVTGNANVIFTNNSNAVVEHNVTVDNTASLTFETNCNLIQNQNTQNIGSVTIKRNSSALKRLDYTIWSSPTKGSQTLKQFSPNTDTDRFYIYNTALNAYSNLNSASQQGAGGFNPNNSTFVSGKGYLVRVPNSFSATVAQVFEGKFQGTPNNGRVEIALSTAGNGYNAVGNPYPSPINIVEFINTNIDNIEGTLWIWRKTNDPSQSTYATVSKAGYTANQAPGGVNDLVQDPFQIGGEEGVLNTGQGFLVKAINAKPLVFRNDMRRADNISYFFRPGQEQSMQANSINSLQGEQKGRIWINITNNTGSFTQALIAYTPEATLGYDNGYDGRSIADGAISLYTYAQNDTRKLAIQARPAFTQEDVVALGFKTNTAGNFEISINNADGVFVQNQDIFLKDKLTGVITNLKNQDYSFTTAEGTFEDRFEIFYTNEALGIDTPVVNAKDVIIFAKDRQIAIQAPEVIQSIVIYDILGRTVYQKENTEALQFTTPQLGISQQVAIVKITLENKQVISKKIILN